MIVQFFVPIKPIGKARARVTARGTYTPAATKRAEAHVASEARLAMARRKPADGPVGVQIIAHMPIPPSWTKARQKAALDGFAHPTGRPDCDNISKLVLDACNGIVYRDDSQVIHLMIHKRYSAAMGIEVRFDLGE